MVNKGITNQQWTTSTGLCRTMLCRRVEQLKVQATQDNHNVCSCSLGLPEPATNAWLSQVKPATVSYVRTTSVNACCYPGDPACSPSPPLPS